jgi:N-acetylglucosaminyldiphosphoundecaprenol N-acetyl-beta-D-mannosaminyltransferase
VDILGVRVDDVTYAEALETLRRAIAERVPHVVTTPNPEFVMLARGDAGIAEVAREADLVVPDGTGVAVASAILGPAIPRVPGRILVDALVPLLADRDASIFLLGAAPGVADRAADTLRLRVPGVRIAGCYAGDASDNGDSAARVRTAAPAVLLVAFGMPKQELWIARNLDALPSVKLAIGVGGVFDQLAGVRTVPPRVVHKVGLEWLWRLVREPWRWRRQRVLPLFAALVLRKRVTGR